MKKLIHSTHPLLNAPSAVVERDDGSIKQLLLDLDEVIRVTRAQGVAAVQIGVPKRAIVISTGGFKQAFINPHITKAYGGVVTSKEGCISFPVKLVSIVRSRQVIIEGFDENWEPITRKLKGKAAICAQHEVDHLEGITILSKRA